MDVYITIHLLFVDRVSAWNLILHGRSGEGVSQSRVRVSQTSSESIGQFSHVSLSVFKQYGASSNCDQEMSIVMASVVQKIDICSILKYQMVGLPAIWSPSFLSAWEAEGGVGY